MLWFLFLLSLCLICDFISCGLKRITIVRILMLMLISFYSEQLSAETWHLKKHIRPMALMAIHSVLQCINGILLSITACYN